MEFRIEDQMELKALGEAIGRIEKQVRLAALMNIDSNEILQLLTDLLTNEVHNLDFLFRRIVEVGYAKPLQIKLKGY